MNIPVSERKRDMLRAVLSAAQSDAFGWRVMLSRDVLCAARAVSGRPGAILVLSSAAGGSGTVVTMRRAMWRWVLTDVRRVL